MASSVFSLLTTLLAILVQTCIITCHPFISSLPLLSEQLHYFLLRLLIAGPQPVVVWNINQSEASTGVI